MKTGSGTINAGETASYTIAITNNGPGAATNVTLTPPDTLPDGGLDWQLGDQGIGTTTNGTACQLSAADVLTCTIPSLAATRPTG